MHTSIGQVALLALSAVATLVEAGSQSNTHGPRRLAQPRHQNIRKALSSQAEPAGLEKRQAFSGKGSFYDPETGNQGACGGFIRKNDWVVALNTEQWDGGSHCGQQVTIHWKGQTQVATIRDACPGCGWGGLDLTPGLFASLEPLGTGIIRVSWDFGSVSAGGGNNNGGGNSSPPPPPPPPPPRPTTPAWTPEPTPEWTPPPSTSSRRPTTTWHQEEQNTWTPPSSSSSRSSSSSSTPSSSWSSSSSSSSSSTSSRPSSSSSSSSLASSSSQSANATSTATNATSAANSTLSATSIGMHTTVIDLGNGTSTTATLSLGPNGAVSTQTPNATFVGAGSLHNVNQAVLQMAGLIVDSVKA